jgi:hypothetical protein
VNHGKDTNMSAECYKNKCIYHNKVEPFCDEKECREKTIMNKKDFIKCIKQIQKDFAKVDQFIKDIGHYFDSYLFELGCELLNTQIDILKTAMNDNNKDSWIDWYIYENDFGKKCLEAGYDNKVRKINTFEDLYNLMVNKGESK